MSAIHEILAGRRTAHKYKAEKIPENIIENALIAANHAPNHKLTFPWRFHIVGPSTRASLANLAISIKAQGAPVSAEITEAINLKFFNPGALITVTNLKDSDAFRDRENYAAVACAIQNMMLSFWADGFASKWSTGGITRHEDTYKILQISQSEQDIVGFVWAGVAEKLPTPINRPSLDSVIKRHA